MAVRSSVFFVGLLFVCLSACVPGSKGPPAIGEAYVGPATLNLRQELAPKSAVVGTVKHGERLDVVQTRRRFVRVRSKSGMLGWTDSRQLLSTAQMEQLRKLSEAAAALPSEGSATVFEALNMHTEPARLSPSFAQIPDNGSVQVLAHKLAPKVAPVVPAAPIAVPKKIAPKKKKSDVTRVPPPPMPKAPPLPANWLELSRSAAPETPAEEAFAKEVAGDRRTVKETPERPEDKAIPMEDWSLVRMKDGRSGWVLSRLLAMSIPDEVAQYAEGHRITSYFPLADIKDGDATKHCWLWTTISRNGQPYEFDKLRVFIWSLRRHRYETAYIERNIEGYYPLEVLKTGDNATFSAILKTDEGFVKKTYAFNGYRVNVVSRTPFQPPAPPASGEPAGVLTSAPPATPPAETGVFSKLKDKAKSLMKK